MHCNWFHVFDLWASCNGWVSGAAGSTSVLEHLGPGCVFGKITRVFGKNNLVPTVTASFDVLEAGDMVEGCSIGFRFGFAGSNQ